MQIENFVVHPERRGGQRTDADLLAVRFPHRAERLFDDPQDIMADDAHRLALSRDLIDVLIVEVKTNQPCTLNDAAGPAERPSRACRDRLPSTRPHHRRGGRHLPGWYPCKRHGLRIRLVAVGRNHSDELAALYPGVTQLIWSHLRTRTEIRRRMSISGARKGGRLSG